MEIKEAQIAGHDNEAFEIHVVGETSSSSCNSDSEQQETTIEFSSLKDNIDTEMANKSQFEKNLETSNAQVNSLIGAKKMEEDATISSSSSIESTNEDGFTISWHNIDFVVESKWYKLSSTRKLILNGLSGSFKSGELTAILGPSGAGKSTLIDCLVGKRERGLSGTTRVHFKGIKYDKKSSKQSLRIATIPQKDHLLDTLTVMETFMFASKIKNAHLTYEEDPKSGKRQPFDHFANVQRVIKQLHLSSCATLRCAKLSGGQYKRVSIGQELLSRPDLMILDEPTSGLDSVTCYQTINALRQLIQDSPYPIAIVATIHQPDVEVFELFHKAYVLAGGGRAIYEGPTQCIFKATKEALELIEAREKLFPSSSQQSKAQLEDLNLQLEANERRNCNPAKLIVELAANEYGYEIINALNKIQQRDHNIHSNQSNSELSSNWLLNNNITDNNSSQSTLALTTLRQQEPSQSSPSSDAILMNPRPPTFDYASNDPLSRKADLDRNLKLVNLASNSGSSSVRVWFKHLIQHTSRSWITIVRDPMLFSVQFFLHVFVPLLISYSFQGHRGDACPKVGALDVINEAYRINGTILDDLNVELRLAFENLGYMFFQIYVIIFAAVCVTSLTYPLVMHVLVKEYRNGWYSMSSYFLGRTLADLPIPTFNVVLAMAISYHLTGQPLSPYGWRFISVALLTVLATLVAQTWGLMFGAMLMNAPQAAVFVAPASTAPLVVVSGFLIRIKSLPIVLQILSHLSYFTHLLNGFIVSRYGFNKCECNEEDFNTDLAHQVPQQARGIIDLWVESFQDEYPNVNSSSVNLIGKLVDTISKAKTFGYEMTNCSQVKPFTMLDYDLKDSDLAFCFAALICMLFFFRWLTYIVLSWKISSSI